MRPTAAAALTIIEKAPAPPSFLSKAQKRIAILRLNLRVKPQLGNPSVCVFVEVRPPYRAGAGIKSGR